VVGRTHPDRVVRKGGARPGDQLVLTKPIGTGILTTALKQQRIPESDIRPAVEVMSALNADAARAMVERGAHAATDVTGFGLLGHLSEMLRASDAGAELSFGAVPLLDGAADLASEDVAPGGTRKNLTAVAGICDWSQDLGAAARLLLADAQTSGGLLIAVAPERADPLLERLRELGTPAAARIGEITSGPGIRITP